MSRALHNPNGTTIYYDGPGLDEGPLPAVIYFALSSKASLYEDPFNQPVVTLAKSSIRTFSWDLPFHEEGADFRAAMGKWVLEFMHNPHFLNEFILTCKSNIDYLIEQNIMKATQIAVAGLSRGSFVATHLAAQDHRLSIILGFAPLTQPRPLEDFDHLALPYEHLGLSHLAPHLTHKHLRFYIGNHDTRVGTDTCFNFVHTLSQTAYNSGIRSPQIELIVYPSIGYRGHGTPPEIFLEGANWIKKKLLNQ